MHLKNKPEFVSVMTNIAELYKEKLSVARLEIYWRCLQHYDLETIQKALDTHALNPDQGQFMPKPADIVRLLEGSHVTQAIQASHKVRQAIQAVGAYSSIIFDDPLIHAVIANMGGWITLCHTSEKELPFRMREFEKLYLSYMNQKPKQIPKLLAGVFQENNQHQGYLLCKPVLFGNNISALTIVQQHQIEASTESLQSINPLNQIEEDKS